MLCGRHAQYVQHTIGKSRNASVFPPSLLDTSRETAAPGGSRADPASPVQLLVQAREFDSCRVLELLQRRAQEPHVLLQEVYVFLVVSLVADRVDELLPLVVHCSSDRLPRLEAREHPRLQLDGWVPTGQACILSSGSLKSLNFSS